MSGRSDVAGFLCFVACAVGIGSVAHAVPTEWGAAAHATTRNCPSFCTSGGGDNAGGYQSHSVSASITDSLGTSFGFANFDSTSGISIPKLGAFAQGSGGAGSNGGARTEVSATEGYTYDGAATKTFSIDMTMHATVDEPVGATVLLTSDIIVILEDGDWTWDDFPPSGGEEIVEGGVGFPTILAQTSFFSNSTETLNETDNITFDIDPGQSFYVFTHLRTEVARQGSVIDAASTLTLAFQDFGGLTTASVPEPTAWLLLTFAGWLAAATRRKSSIRFRQ